MTSQDSNAAFDYLGHPCSLALALSHFEDAVTPSRESRPDPRWLAQWVGREMVATHETVDTMQDALELACEMAITSGCNERLIALLRMAVEYAKKSNEKAYFLGGGILYMMERADLVRPSQMAQAAAQ